MLKPLRVEIDYFNEMTPSDLTEEELKVVSEVYQQYMFNFSSVAKLYKFARYYRRISDKDILKYLETVLYGCMQVAFSPERFIQSEMHGDVRAFKHNMKELSQKLDEVMEELECTMRENS